MHDSWFHEFDATAALTQFPTGAAFIERFSQISCDELHQMQNRQFMSLIQRGWQIPFYQRLWGNVGIEAGDIQSLDDLPKLPTFDKSHLMESIENHPPYGDFHGFRPGARAVVHTTTGTTGRPQTLLYGVHSREMQNLLLARAYLFQGMRHDDVVHSIYGFGMVNGGHYVREAILHFTKATLLPAGTGRDTPSARQVELMRDFSATVIVGFADYMRKLAETALDAGIKPGQDIPLRMISGHMGRESKSLISSLWGGAEVFDWYGVGDTGTIAAEGPDHDGLYLWEDAHLVEVLDPENGAAVADGEPGNLVDTVLFKQDIYPIIRFNTQDVTRVLPGQSSLGLNLQRIEGFLGRSDNMVKLRGINVFPHAFAGWIAEFDALNGEYLCVVSRDDAGRDEMTLFLETRTPSDSALAEQVSERMRNGLGLAVNVVLREPGALASQTQVEHRQKAIRLIDERFYS
jgi:phenylacetate-CoA ligase